MAASPYQALYRRYRPQRFDEVLGQDHVTKALRNAVRDNRVGHAYLFSGPRGTGKTSTARILAKVLNCANPTDGEPCGQCQVCQAVERGQVTDWLLEQDAASKSKVDDMRDLLDRVPLGTSGKRKVIILDEVHMLSQGAENALLKTLEEPPAHVVFVLATTDPQKVRPTIRSRTQHFAFRLLSPDVLSEHVRHVIGDAGLSIGDDDQAIAHVLKAGAGSARDALSALDQVAALGEVMADAQPVDAIVDALVARDAGAVLVAVAEATATGRDPRALGESLITRLRDAFLALMGADGHLPEGERVQAKAIGDQLGAAGLTRALDVLGEALTELSRKPDPRVVVEVALVRLVRPEADRSIDAILERLERLESAVRSGEAAGGTDAGPRAAGGTAEPNPTKPAGGSTTQASRGSTSSPPSTDAGPAAAPDGGGPGEAAGPASAARAALATSRPSAPTKKRQPPPPKAAPSPSASEPSPPTSSPTPSAPTAEAPTAVGQASTAPPATVGRPDISTLTSAWSSQVLGSLAISVRSKWRGGSWLDITDEGVARFAVPNQWHKKACDEGRLDVEKALAEQFGDRLPVEVVVESGDGGAGPGTAGSTSEPAGPGSDPDEHIAAEELAELADADDVATGGVDLLMREFGGELIEEDPR
jgi:DNA polymerase-3 subunit gamma/tau